jgi:hypothetical protein
MGCDSYPCIYRVCIRQQTFECLRAVIAGVPHSRISHLRNRAVISPSRSLSRVTTRRKNAHTCPRDTESFLSLLQSRLNARPVRASVN